MKWDRKMLASMIIISHSIAFMVIAKADSTPDLGFDWRTQALSIMAVLSLCSLASIAIKQETVTGWLLTLCSVLVLLLSFSYCESLLLKLTLTLPLGLQLMFLVREPYHYWFYYVYLAVVLLFQLPYLYLETNVGVPDKQDVWIVLFFLAIVGALSFFLRKSLGQRAERDNRIQTLQQNAIQLTKGLLQYQLYANSVEQDSKNDERKRITRELHDIVGYTLMNISMMIEAAIRQTYPEQLQLAELLSTMSVHTKDAILEARKVLYLLRDQDKEPIRGMDAINRLIHIFQQATGIEIVCEYGDMSWVHTDEIAHFIFRLVQESLVNAFKHSNAEKVHIHMSQYNGMLAINIVDNGKGCHKLQEGIGITGIRERVQKLGGRLSVIPDLNGFCISAWVPVKERKIRHG